MPDRITVSGGGKTDSVGGMMGGFRGGGGAGPVADVPNFGSNRHKFFVHLPIMNDVTTPFAKAKTQLVEKIGR